MNVGEKIKYLREERGLSQQQLANMLGYKSRNAIYQFEKAHNMKLSVISKFAKVFNVPESYFLSQDDCEPNNLSEKIKLLKDDEKAIINKLVDYFISRQ